VIASCKPAAEPPSDPLVEQQAAQPESEPEGTQAAEEEATEAPAPTGTLTVQLKNLCPRKVRYVIHPAGESVENPIHTIAGGATERIEVPADHFVGHPGSRGGAMTEVDGGVVWFGKNCKTVGASDDPEFDPSTFKSGR